MLQRWFRNQKWSVVSDIVGGFLLVVYKWDASLYNDNFIENSPTWTRGIFSSRGFQKAQIGSNWSWNIHLKHRHLTFLDLHRMHRIGSILSVSFFTFFGEISRATYGDLLAKGLNSLIWSIARRRRGHLLVYTILIPLTTSTMRQNIYEGIKSAYNLFSDTPI